MVFQNKIQRRTAEQIVDMPFPKMEEEPVFKVFSQDRVHNIEYPADEPISQIMKERVEVVKTVFQDLISERICEQGEVIEVSSQDRMSRRAVEQTLDKSFVPSERAQQQTAKRLILPKSWTHCSSRNHYYWFMLPASSVTRVRQESGEDGVV